MPEGTGHPAQYSQKVLDMIEHLIAGVDTPLIYDPFAGTGLRLGALCDRLGVRYEGGDIEDWPGKDPRVQIADAMDLTSYPIEPFTVVTSPTYVNKRLGDYANGPGPNTVLKGRRDYGIGLGRALHENNTARYTGRPKKADKYWEMHTKAACCWGDTAIVNVDGPIADGWVKLLSAVGYDVCANIEVVTPRYGGLSNADKRAPAEAILVATR